MLTAMRVFVSRLLGSFRRQRFDAGIEEEFQSHLQMLADRFVSEGMTKAEALRAAKQQFGGVAQVEEELRERSGLAFLDSLWQDVRYGLRQLRRSPGFTAVAVITLALGIGANTAIFTLVHAVMLQSLPVKAPGELYRLGDTNDCCVNTGFQGDVSLYSTALYEYLRDHTPEFSSLAAFEASTWNIGFRRSGSSAARSGVQEYVSGNYFQMFGISAIEGRLLTLGDDKLGAAPVAVMSYHAWQDIYASDPSIVGSTFVIDATPFTIIGVTPPDFYGDTLRSNPPDIWLPLSAEVLQHKQDAISNFPDESWLYIVGRLKPGQAVGAVQAHATAEVRQWYSAQSFIPEQDRGDIGKQRVVVTPAGAGISSLRENYGDGLRFLIVISGFVLLIACANVAGLLLARAMASRLQTAVRIALGATRSRLIRLTITEGVLLSVLGGIVGLLFAFDATRTILLLAFRGADYVPISANPSTPVLVFTLVISMLTGIVFATAPAWMASHTNPNDALRSARTPGDRSSLARKSLVVLQTGLSFTLLVGAGLLTVSLHRLENQRFGFETKDRLIVHINPLLAGYAPTQLPALYNEIEQRFGSLPGILSVSYSLYSPMEGDNWSSQISVEGNPHPNAGQRRSPSWLRVGPHYFETIGTPLLRGRAIDGQDTANSQHVAAVNETFAREFFSKQDPLGKTFGIGNTSHSHDFEIVGVVQDAKYQNAKRPAYPTFFIPYFQSGTYKEASENQTMLRSNSIGDIELHTAGNAEKMEAAARETLASIDPNLVPLKILSLASQVSGNFDQERLIERLTVLYGLLALILATVGLYGVIASTVSRRTNEIGIRMALGAHPRNIFSAVILEGATLAFIGIGLGFGAAFALVQLMSSVLYGIAATDLSIFAAAAALVALAALVGCYIPARRAMRVDPMVALRYE